ncbi:MAG TPA: SMI1/KNR4 family protein [Vitreimonas sp.]|uniref:SMI1/KNR4 family protein n=1 Tax=Vitreimonas sp. TaxID=3069702 RepID=UPI002D4ACDC5|nr:SMI1/KNR4 family protein [Vitreimonas sp.]HYD89481.1 SMI1/KNR4 family protein [Vitreimonas sp.]
MNLGSEFRLEAGASEEVIQRLLSEIGCDLPHDYLTFMRTSNGGEGFIGKEYLRIWKIEDVATWSKDYVRHTPFEETDELLLFGGNGGGEAFGFDWVANGAIVEAPMIGMERQYLLHCADTFSEFLKNPTGFKE